MSNTMVVISDRVDHGHCAAKIDDDFGGVTSPRFAAPAITSVSGGYLERLPLAAMISGLVSRAEVWHHHRSDCLLSSVGDDGLTRRAFPLADEPAPFDSASMEQFLLEFGAPKILCVWGLGVSERVLCAAKHSFKIYNSIDAPALRVPAQVSRHFDLVLTGAEWQSAVVKTLHPQTPTIVLPVGPEFASPETFYPVDCDKLYDVIYVAAAQHYKRHDLLFDALARSPRPLTCLCVMGYGDEGDKLRAQAAAMGIAVEFVGPPGVSYSEVNRFMNQSRVGVVCGVDDGAPAILTEYMLAGLPVVANADLCCGLQYILPRTGVVARGDAFELGIIEALDRTDFNPRQTVLDRWSWLHSIDALQALVKPQHDGAIRSSASER